MKVTIICPRDHETQVVNLPISEEELLKIQGKVMDRDRKGYILGDEAKYYDEKGKEIENIFLLNRELQYR